MANLIEHHETINTFSRNFLFFGQLPPKKQTNKQNIEPANIKKKKQTNNDAQLFVEKKDSGMVVG